MRGATLNTFNARATSVAKLLLAHVYMGVYCISLGSGKAALHVSAGKHPATNNFISTFLLSYHRFV